MNIRTREPLNAELEALLNVERRPLAQSEAVRARAFARMRTAVAAPALSSRRPRFEMARVVWPAAAVLGFGAAAAAAVRMDHYFSTPLAIPAAVANSALASARDAQSTAQPPLAPQSGGGSGLESAGATPAPPASSATQPRRAVTTTTEAKVAPSAQSPTSATGSESYPQELALLQPARSAIGRGDFAAALAAISEHSRRFPSGLLSEERDALRVRALFGSHRDAEARRAAAAFSSRYPRSALLSSIARKVENTP